jgi:septum formation protein
MNRRPRVILASASATRIALIKAAGIPFSAVTPGIDERKVEAPLVTAGRPPAEVAMTLAEAKALSVGPVGPEALVIGADQVLDLDGRRLTKPATMGEARSQILSLAGRSHLLHSALAVAREGRIAWRHLESPRLTMRPLAGQEVDAYLDEVGRKALESVGGYQIEGPGIRLFDGIEGDFFAILGLPLLPLVKWLRSAGAVS